MAFCYSGVTRLSDTNHNAERVQGKKLSSLPESVRGGFSEVMALSFGLKA
jgi:hypothetical protein